MAAASTYKEIQDRVLDLLSKSDSTTRNRVKNWINMGQYDFVTRELWPFRLTTGTLNTVNGTQEYSLSSNFSDIDAQNIVNVAIQGADSALLPFIARSQLRGSSPDLDLEGVALPQTYYVTGSNIGFWPSPGSAYTVFIDYYKLPTELSADADESIIPKSYREGLVHYALSYEHDFNTDPDLALKAMNRYEEIVTLARNNLLVQPVDTGTVRILGPADNVYWLD